MRSSKSLAARIAAATVSIVCCAATVITLGSSPVEARHQRRTVHVKHHFYGRAAYRQSFRAAVRGRHHHHLPVDASGGIAAMVVDANTGRTLFAERENEIRHPASVTKVMTLYLLFEQMHRGRLTLATPIGISEHAAAQPPTKIGLRPGSSITLDNAIKAIVTESANDIAVAVAEAVGGSESNFAALMTRKAHALGMSQTVYVNASGLPDDRQVTTAHDLTILGRAIQERYPDEYAYFSTRNFVYGGRAHHNHNHLLGQIDGVDGIKTGYTRASGFNLLASVRRNGRHIVSVVIGGKSSVSRDRIMTSLIEQNIAQAAEGRSVAMIAENDTPEPVAVAAVTPVAVSAEPQQLAAVEQVAQTSMPTQLSPVTSSETTAPVVTASLASAPPAAAGGLRTFGDETASIGRVERVADVVSGVPEAPGAPGAPVAATGMIPGMASAYADTPAERHDAVHWAAGPAHRRTAERHASQTAQSRREDTGKSAARAEDGAPPSPSAVESRSRVAQSVTAQSPRARAGWIIQVGASPDLGKANDLLARARSQQSLASAQPFTEKVRRGEHTLYRARFAGLQSGQAEAACKALKHQGFPCIAMRN